MSDTVFTYRHAPLRLSLTRANLALVLACFTASSLCPRFASAQEPEEAVPIAELTPDAEARTAEEPAPPAADSALGTDERGPPPSGSVVAQAATEEAEVSASLGDVPPDERNAGELDHPEAPDDHPADQDAGFSPKFTAGIGMRTGLNYTFDNPEGDPVLKLDDGLVDQVNARPFWHGALTENLGFFVQLELGTANGLGFEILDAIAEIKLIDEIQLWIGQQIGANDRNNTNGPFFTNTWNLAIAVPSYPFDVGARDRGATLWGLIADGHVKYHLSVMDAQPDRNIAHARFAGRLTVDLLEPESSYYNSGTYWGEKDVLALGAVVHSQKGVDVDPADPDADPDNDFFGYSFDAFFEKNLGSAGTITLEGGYWNFEQVGSGYIVNQGTVDSGMGIVGGIAGTTGTAFMGIASWLTPEKIGIGYLQPNFRFQHGDYEPARITTLDFGLAYVIDGFNHKYHVNYRRQEIEPAGAPAMTASMIQLGAQFMMSN